jgi:predicted NUDIX family NTP pyrophosphohydrolase
MSELPNRGLKCCSSTPVALSGATGTTERGRYRRAKSRPEKSRNTSLGASSRKNLGYPLQDRFGRSPKFRQRGGKRVHAFAVQGDLDVGTIVSNTFEMIWPPKSGRSQRFPEVDRAEWFALPVARNKILEGQRPLLDRLQELVSR